MNSRLLTPYEVAERLQISRITVLNHLRSGLLKGTKVGRLWRVSEEALAAFCNAPTQHGNASAQHGTPLAQRGTPLVQYGIARVSDASSGQRQPQTSSVCRDALPKLAYGASEREFDELDRRWLDANWDRALPPYEWGPSGIPAMRPVRYVHGQGLVIEGEEPHEQE